MSEATNDDNWVIGWGRTKHIPHPDATDKYRLPMGLCGAYGGNPLAAPSRPTRKHCLRIAAADTPKAEAQA